VRTLVFDFFDPLAVSRLEGVIWEIFVGSFTFALFKAMSLEMPLVASCDAGVIERRGGSIYPLVEDEMVISCANPIRIRVWVPD